MQEQRQQFLKLYQECRYEDQSHFYQERLEEFRQARDEVINIQTVLMVLTAATAVLTFPDLPWKFLWVLLSMIFPVLSTMLTSYDGLYDFERHAKLYQDALNALYRASAEDPDLPSHQSEDERTASMLTYVNQIERILHKERGQWGQLVSEVRPSEPPELSHE